MKNVIVLGSTGSIGTQTLDVVRNNEDLHVVALAAGSNIELLEKQIKEFKPEIVCVYLGEGNGNPLQCSCLENPRDRGAW